MKAPKKVLLMGEFSNVHWTLAEGLRKEGHLVTVASKGDGWKDYKRDIDLRFTSKKEVARFFFNILFSSEYTGYDYVQFINFRFLYPEERDIYNKWVFAALKKRNKAVYLGAFGDDYYWAKACAEHVFPYSNYDALASGFSDNIYYSQMLRLANPSAKKLNHYMATQANGIVAGLYDYHTSYERTEFNDKLSFIPFPINLDNIPRQTNTLQPGEKLRIFLGIQQSRSQWKGTDKLHAWLKEYTQLHATETELSVAVSVPYDQYVHLYDSSHVFVDQLYSQGFAMNALHALAKSKIVLSGGEEAMYALYGNTESKPVWNITPDKEQVFQQLDSIRENKQRIAQWGEEARLFVEQHHHYVTVARQYINEWEKFI
jgi:hypothetical protein